MANILQMVGAHLVILFCFPKRLYWLLLLVKYDTPFYYKKVSVVQMGLAWLSHRAYLIFAKKKYILEYT